MKYVKKFENFVNEKNAAEPDVKPAPTTVPTRPSPPVKPSQPTKPEQPGKIERPSVDPDPKAKKKKVTADDVVERYVAEGGLKK